MIESPCTKDCAQRHEGCHGTCKKYIDYDLENKKRRESHDERKEYFAYIASRRKKRR